MGKPCSIVILRDVDVCSLQNKLLTGISPWKCIVFSVLLSVSCFCAEKGQPLEVLPSPEEQSIVSLMMEEIEIEENKSNISELNDENFSEEIDLLSDIDLEILDEISIEP